MDAKVAANLTDVGLMLQAEAEENTCRKAFTPTEAESIARAREEWLVPLAVQAKAQAVGKPRGEKAAVSGANFAPETSGSADRKTRQIAAKGTGYSHATLAKVREVKEAAADETRPEPVREAAREALTNMDRSGKVAGEHKRVKIAEQAAEAGHVRTHKRREHANPEGRPTRAQVVKVRPTGAGSRTLRRTSETLTESPAHGTKPGISDHGVTKTHHWDVIMTEPTSRNRTANRDAQIWQRYLNGETQAKIAESYGISRPMVSRIVARMRDDVPVQERKARQRRQLAELDHLRGEALAVVDSPPIPAYSNGRPILMGDDTQAEDHTARLRAMGTVLRLQEREARALGLDSQMKVSAEAQDAAERVKALIKELVSEDDI